MWTPPESPRPFRWDLAQRDRLGSLLEGPAAPIYEGFLDDLLHAGARVISLCDDSDLFFVGRSLESMFDLLSGLMLETSWADRLHLLHFSNRRLDPSAIRAAYPAATPALRAYLTGLQLTPSTVATRARPVAFVDVVSSGSTLGNLIDQFITWSRESDSNWRQVAEKLRIVGLTSRENTSPNTWRWQQHADWTRALRTGAIKNVSVPGRMYDYVGNQQVKVSHSFPPWRWGDENMLRPRRDEKALEALRLAVSLFDLGTEKQTRMSFAGMLAEQDAMRYPWFRSLALDLKR